MYTSCVHFLSTDVVLGLTLFTAAFYNLMNAVIDETISVCDHAFPSIRNNTSPFITVIRGMDADYPVLRHHQTLGDPETGHSSNV